MGEPNQEGETGEVNIAITLWKYPYICLPLSCFLIYLCKKNSVSFYPEFMLQSGGLINLLKEDISELVKLVMLVLIQSFLISGHLL